MDKVTLPGLLVGAVIGAVVSTMARSWLQPIFDAVPRFVARQTGAARAGWRDFRREERLARAVRGQYVEKLTIEEWREVMVEEKKGAKLHPRLLEERERHRQAAMA